MNKCQDCRWCSWPTPYHHPETPETLPLTYKCQRRAPVVTGGMMSSIVTIWPEVKADDGCGEWEFAEGQNPSSHPCHVGYWTIN